MKITRLVTLGLLLLTSMATLAQEEPEQPANAENEELPAAAKRQVDFARDVQPIFQAKCLSCHGPEEQESGFRLDIGASALEGGDSGKAVLPGKSAESLLVLRIAGVGDDDRMPPEDEGTPLTDREVAIVRAWIDQGANWPKSADADQVVANHWAFLPIADPPLPEVKDAARVQNGIDAFIIGKLEQEGITLSPAANRATLIRRVHLDLIGLPPSPKEVQTWINDPRDDWYDHLVDDLLDSPHYGERWARHWLDLARYADSDGYEKDKPRPYAWRWRDWVINALNDNKPFDEFTIEQIAGDLLPNATIEQRVATGFNRNTLINREGGIDPEEDRFKRTVDRTNTLGKVWLGMTVECGQCHSHKYDPLPQKEYYRLYAFFNTLTEPDIGAPLPSDQTTKAQVVEEMKSPRKTHFLVRGDFLSPDYEVTAGTPAAFIPLKPRGENADRLDLARWLVEPDHPLTARVTVNRIWARYFGRGIVPTIKDFGTQGAKPSHPELLDWLAKWFQKNDWDLKALHKLMVTSATYRQSSNERPECHERDPLNAWLSHQNRLRVEGEIVRDAALSVSGLIKHKIGGPSVRPPQPAGIAGLGYAGSVKWKTSEGVDRYRRGLYTFFQRTVPYPMLMTFDSPDSNLSCVRRERSNTPLQALALWNDPVFFECARELGKRIVNETKPAGESSEGEAQALVERRIHFAFHTCLSREPTGKDLAAVCELVEEQRRMLKADVASAKAIAGDDKLPDDKAIELAVWITVGRTMLNLDEFVTRG
ncbi:MAG: PSD1 and planctomycete cytochrome C domain-containing protein [Pirellulaceae bacterium]